MRALLVLVLVAFIAACGESPVPQRGNSGEGSAAQSAAGGSSDEGKAARSAGR
jgi:hypothetical protein